jgi:ABC-type sugar transport system permease subunit
MPINRQKIAPYLFVLPFVLLFGIFEMYPIGYSLYISFFRWENAGPEAFVGLQNYLRYFAGDHLFLVSLRNTLILLVTGSLLQHVFALPLAIALNQRMVKGRQFFRTVYFLPYITNAVSVAIIFQQLYNPSDGVLNYLIERIGLQPLEWLREPKAMKASLSIVLNWRFIGYYTIIYLAGLQSIPADLYESARIDGASRWQQHLRVTLPMLVPIIFFGVSITLIFGMQLFDEPYILCGGFNQWGGVKNGGLTTTLLMMTLGFSLSKFGRAAAVSWLLFVVILVLTLSHRFITDKLDYTKN